MLEKACSDITETGARIDAKEEQYQGKSDAELNRIIRSGSAFFEEKTAAKKILYERNKSDKEDSL